MRSSLRHSSMGRSTAVSTPRLVTICGPSVMAVSSSSLNFDLASCTGHFLLMIHSASHILTRHQTRYLWFRCQHFALPIRYYPSAFPSANTCAKMDVCNQNRTPTARQRARPRAPVAARRPSQLCQSWANSAPSRTVPRTARVHPWAIPVARPNVRQLRNIPNGAECHTFLILGQASLAPQSTLQTRVSLPHQSAQKLVRGRLILTLQLGCGRLKIQAFPATNQGQMRQIGTMGLFWRSSSGFQVPRPSFPRRFTAHSLRYTIGPSAKWPRPELVEGPRPKQDEGQRRR